jgi:hypothetical protein
MREILSLHSVAGWWNLSLPLCRHMNSEGLQFCNYVCSLQLVIEVAELVVVTVSSIRTYIGNLQYILYQRSSTKVTYILIDHLFLLYMLYILICLYTLLLLFLWNLILIQIPDDDPMRNRNMWDWFIRYYNIECPSIRQCIFVGLSAVWISIYEFERKMAAINGTQLYYYLSIMP